MKNEMRRNFKGTNNTNVTLVKADHKSVIFEVTSNAVGFKTMIKLHKRQLNCILSVIRQFSHTTVATEERIINDVLVKHRELTKRCDEREATYKYYDENHGFIKLLHLGDQMIMIVGDYDKVFATITFNVYAANNALPRLNFLLGEESMNEWTR